MLLGDPDSLLCAGPEELNVNLKDASGAGGNVYHGEDGPTSSHVHVSISKEQCAVVVLLLKFSV